MGDDQRPDDGGLQLPPPPPEREEPPHPGEAQSAGASTSLNSRLAPQDITAERSVLGAILLTNDALFDVVEVLKAEDFYREPHRKIFKAMQDLSQRAEPIDIITLGDELRRAGALEEVGGPAYISSLDAFVPVSGNIGRYAKIVRDAAHDRRRIEAGHAIAAAGYAQLGTVEDRDTAAERVILAATQATDNGEGLVRVGSTLKALYATLEAREQSGDEISGLRTNLPSLDRLTAGFQPGHLVYIMGRPGSGKTSLLQDFLIACCVEQGLPAATFCMEMTRDEMVQRMVASIGNINHDHLRGARMDIEEWKAVAVAMDVIGKAPLYIDETPAQTIMSIRGKCLRLRAKYGQLGMIGVDYIQLMDGTGEENREQQINAISRGLKRLAGEMKCPVVALTQMNRNLGKREDKRPQMEDARESGSIEQDANVMLGTYRAKVHFADADPTEAEVIVLKQRAGPTGTVRARFRGEYFRFDPEDLF